MRKSRLKSAVLGYDTASLRSSGNRSSNDTAITYQKSVMLKLTWLWSRSIYYQNKHKLLQNVYTGSSIIVYIFHCSIMVCHVCLVFVVHVTKSNIKCWQIYLNAITLCCVLNGATGRKFTVNISSYNEGCSISHWTSKKLC